MKTCFVISPIGQADSDIRKNADKLLEFILEPVCTSKGFDLVRIDQVSHTDKIDSKILEYLETSDLVIADTSTQNPNCFYEIGYRTALKKPIILLKRYDESLPFDVASIRCISYGFDVAQSKSAQDELIKTIDAIDFQTTTNETTPKKETTNNDIYQAVLNLSDRVDDIPRKFNAETIDILASKISNPSLSPEENLAHTIMNFCMNADPERAQKIIQNLSRLKFE